MTFFLMQHHIPSTSATTCSDTSCTVLAEFWYF